MRRILLLSTLLCLAHAGCAPDAGPGVESRAEPLIIKTRFGWSDTIGVLPAWARLASSPTRRW